MKIRIISDVHTEFVYEDEGEVAEMVARALPELPDDPATILIIAGDLGSMHRPRNIAAFLRCVAPRFRRVIYTPGNHEYYGGEISTTPAVLGYIASEFLNVAFGVGSMTNIPGGKGVHFHTLWSDFDGGDPISMSNAQHGMNDYRLIRNGERRLRPSDVLEFHKDHLKMLEDLVRPGDVVATHYSPSLLSIAAEFKGHPLNGAYHTDLSKLIERLRPSIWFHGHTHTACDYMLGETRIICNPRGYGQQHKTNGYNPTLVVEV